MSVRHVSLPVFTGAAFLTGAALLSSCQPIGGVPVTKQILVACEAATGAYRALERAERDGQATPAMSLALDIADQTVVPVCLSPDIPTTQEALSDVMQGAARLIEIKLAEGL